MGLSPTQNVYLGAPRFRTSRGRLHLLEYQIDRLVAFVASLSKQGRGTHSVLVPEIAGPEGSIAAIGGACAPSHVFHPMVPVVQLESPDLRVAPPSPCQQGPSPSATMVVLQVALVRRNVLTLPHATITITLDAGNALFLIRMDRAAPLHLFPYSSSRVVSDEDQG